MGQVAPAGGSVIGVIGLGNMGSAVARAVLASHGRAVVWNRSPQPREAMAAAGAQVASDVADLIRGSSIIVVCLGDYDVGLSLLRDSVETLRGRTVVQLTSGTPAQAKDTAEWLASRGATFVEGMIMCFPESVGTEQCRIVYAATAQAFAAAAPFTTAMSGKQLLISNEVGAAVGLGLAVLGFFYVCSEAFVVMAAFARDLGIGSEPVRDELLAQQTVIGQGMEAAAEQLEQDLRSTDTVRIRRGSHNMGMVADAIAARGVDPALVVAAKHHLDAAIEAGYGDGPIASLAHALSRADQDYRPPGLSAGG